MSHICAVRDCRRRERRKRFTAAEYLLTVQNRSSLAPALWKMICSAAFPRRSQSTEAHRGQDSSTRRSTSSRRKLKPRRGATAVEFAVVAIPFFTLVYGAVVFGSLIMVQNVLTGAAADGARLASVRGQSTEAIIEAVNDRLTRGALNAADAEITITPSSHDSAERGTPVAVRVTMAASEASWLDCGLFSLDFDVSSEVTQIKE